MHTRRRFPALLALLAVAAGVTLWTWLTPGSPLRQLVDGFRSEPERHPAPGGPWEPMATQEASGEPIGFDPCEPITYVVDPRLGPGDWRELVETGFANLSRATGLEFVNGGRTKDERWGLERPVDAPVLITWQRERTVPPLVGQTVGVAQPLAQEQDGLLYLTTGSVVLEAEFYRNTFVGEPGRQSVLDHELGHLVGLAHVEDATQLMNADGSESLIYASGDKAGLRALGDLPCAGQAR